MKDWSKERWRKLYLREALQQRLWPVMARGLRDYLIRLAEDDGALIRDADNPLEALLLALGAQPDEAELVRAAIGLLRRDGFLGGGPRSLFVCNLPAAQAWEPRPPAPLPEPAIQAPVSNTSSDRVRQHRERLRQAAALALGAPERGSPAVTGGSEPVSSDVASGVSSVSLTVPRNVTGGVSGVSRNVSSSRGSGKLKSPETFLDLQKDKQGDFLPPTARANGVSSTVPSVSSSVSSTVPSVSSVVPTRAGNEEHEKDEDEDAPLNFPTKTETAPSGEIRARAAEVLRQPALAATVRPEHWPEVVNVAQALSRAAGLPDSRLGQYERDPGVRAIVELYAAGFTQAELQHVAEVLPKQAWWSTGGKRLGLSSLSIEVVRRNLTATAPPREPSPEVAKAIDYVRRRRDAG